MLLIELHPLKIKIALGHFINSWCRLPLLISALLCNHCQTMYNVIIVKFYFVTL